jgi:ribosomal protein S18 acetylase RimI-like enzyme
MSFEIREPEEHALGSFVKFPYDLFRSHPYWTGGLKKDVRRLLDRGHPFWRHGERRLFMAVRDGRTVGRVAAIINSKHNSFHAEKCGFFGFFDCADDQEAASALFAAAVKWLKARGMDKVRGPVNPSANETCGLLIEGFDSPPMAMTPYNPPYYAGLLETCGFHKAKDLHSYRALTKDRFPERPGETARGAPHAGNVKLEPVDTGRLTEALTDLKDIYNSAWDRTWGSVPMTNEEIDEMARGLKPLLKPEHLCFARVNGRPAGFLLLLPDLSAALKGVNGKLDPLNILPFLYRICAPVKRGRLLGLCVKKEFRQNGLEPLLIGQVFASAAALGWEYVDLSWALEDDDRRNSAVSAAGGKIYKKFRIYEKTI